MIENRLELFAYFYWDFGKHLIPISIIIGAWHKAQFFRFTKISFANCWRTFFKIFIKLFDNLIAVFNQIMAKKLAEKYPIICMFVDDFNQRWIYFINLSSHWKAKIFCCSSTIIFLINFNLLITLFKRCAQCMHCLS